jgi:hypothetical protein
MRKSILLVAAVIFSMSTSFAQLSGGLKAGLNLANLNSSEEGWESDMKVGFHVGAFAELGLSESFAIQPELLFSTQGASFEEDGVEADYNLSYLTLPVLAKVKIGEVFNIHAGPQFGLLLSSEAKFGDLEVDTKDENKSVDVGVAFGIGADLPVGLTLAARYNLGLTDIAEENQGEAVKNGVIQISVGYKLFGN